MFDLWTNFFLTAVLALQVVLATDLLGFSCTLWHSPLNHLELHYWQHTVHHKIYVFCAFRMTERTLANSLQYFDISSENWNIIWFGLQPPFHLQILLWDTKDIIILLYNSQLPWNCCHYSDTLINSFEMAFALLWVFLPNKNYFSLKFSTKFYVKIKVKVILTVMK